MITPSLQNSILLQNNDVPMANCKCLPPRTISGFGVAKNWVSKVKFHSCRIANAAL